MRISQLTKVEQTENRRRNAAQPSNYADNFYFVWNPRACDPPAFGGPSNGAPILHGPDYSNSNWIGRASLRRPLQAQCLVL